MHIDQCMSVLCIKSNTELFWIFLFFTFIHNKGINIYMTYNNIDNDQSEIITMSLCLY